MSGDPVARSVAVSLRTRAAAGAALVTALAAVAVAAVGLVREPGRLTLAVAALLIATLAGWDALVHRSLRRYLAGAVVAGALVGAITLVDLHALARIAAVVALVLVSFASARVALHDVLATPSFRTDRVGPAARGVLIVNPHSGGGRASRFDLVNTARTRGITPIVMQAGDDLRALAERAVARGADVLGMAGGDGSQALVADVARRHGLAMVCVPAGTRNHFALDLGLDRDDVVGALDAFGEALEGSVDLGRVNDRVFVNNVSLGIYASVVQSDGYRAAKIRTAAQTLPDLLGPTARGFDLRFDAPDRDGDLEAHIVLVSNNVYRLQRLNGFGTRGRLDQGVLGVVTLTLENTFEVSALLAAQVLGNLRRHRGFRQWRASEFVVGSEDERIDVGVDGEALRLVPPLRFQAMPAALRIRIPRGSHSTTSLPRPGAATVELLLTLAGRRQPRAHAVL